MKKNILISSDTQNLQPSNQQNCIKTILLTGATGYLGGFLSDKFLSKGYNIIALCLNYKEDFKCKQEYEKQVKRYFLDKTELETIFKENNIDIVIHTATLYGRNKESLSTMLEANVIFPVKVLTLASKYKVKMFVNTDTILIKNINAYSLTKNQFVDWLAIFTNDIMCVNMKLDHFYGPNDKPIKFVAWLIQQLKNNVEKIDLTEGSQTRDFIYVDDVVNAYLCVIENYHKLVIGKLNQFEVGTGVRISIKDFVITVKEELHNIKTKLNFGAVPYRKNEVLEYSVDNSALKFLGWEPTIFVKEGIKKILEIEGI
jgi:nucleoside-diphosphate-sugar epimerase